MSVMDWNDLPAWLGDELAAQPDVLAGPAARMRRVIDLAARNVAEGTGGPFAAAVFERDSGRLLAAGVNRVVATHCSHAHAEMVALARAQQRLGNHDLSAPGLPACELVSSCEPCAMCLGAVVWSGVAGLRCGATDADARAIGFDEGPKPADWVAALTARGIAVQTELCRDGARAVLAQYRDRGGEMYGPDRG